MNASDIKKLLLVGTAIVAVGALGITKDAQANPETLGADATWAIDGDQNGAPADGTGAAAGDAVDLGNFTLTFTDNNVANDGGGVGVFTAGNISDSGTGNLVFTSDAADADNAFSVTATSISIAGDATLSNTDAHDTAIDVDVTGFTVVGGNLAITNTDTDVATADLNMDTVGNLTVTGTTALTSGPLSGATTALVVGGDATFTGGVVMTAPNALDTRVVFDGAAAQTVTGTIDGAGAGQGRISVTNTDATDGVTFASEIGTTNTIFGITANSDGNDTRTTFTDDVAVAGTIGFGDNSGSDTNIVEFDSTSNGSFAVTGSVNGGGAADTNTVSVLGANEVTFNNAIGANVDTVSIDSTGTADFNGDINADLTFTADGTAELADNVDITGAVASVGGPLGTLEIEGSSIISGSIGTSANTGLTLIDVQTAAETLTLRGEDAFANAVTVASGATLDLELTDADDSTTDVLTVANTLTVDGATVDMGVGNQIVAGTITGDATYNVVLSDTNGDGTITTNETGTLNTSVADTAIDLSGSTINIDVRNSLANQGVIFANGGVGTTDFADANVNIVSSSLVQDITTNLIGDDVFISIASNIDGVATAGNNSNVAEVLDSLSASTDEQIRAVLNSINGATTANEINEKLEGLTPVADNGAISAAISVTEQGLNVTADRLLSLRDFRDEIGVSSGDMAYGIETWIQAYGTTGDQDNRDGIDGYDLDTVGIALGADTRGINEDMVVGLAASYATTDVDSENANAAQTDIDSYQITAYAEYDVDDRTYVNGQVGYVFGDNETTRSNVGGVAGLTANGEYDSHQIIARLESGRSYPMEYGATLTPKVLMNYIHYDADDFTETGAGGANLTVDSDSVDLLEFGVGADLAWKLSYANGTLVSPMINVGVRHDVIGDEIQSSNNFQAGGATFKSVGADPAQTTFEVGAGVSLLTTNNVELTADYDYEFKEDYDSHSGLVKASYKF